MTTINSRLVEDFTEEEKYLVGQTDAGPDGAYKKITVITEIYIARMNREAARLALEASREIAAASEKYAGRLMWATWALVGVTFLLVIATVALIFKPS